MPADLTRSDNAALRALLLETIAAERLPGFPCIRALLQEHQTRWE
jgi:hypothetical protein